jgi:hypothetical protein
MPLLDVPIPDEPAALPHDLRKFLAEADKRVEAALADARTPAFVPSNYEALFPVLRTLYHSALLRGTTFAEWGSGVGVATLVAAFVGFDAYGIEAEWELVEEARKLADDFDLPAEFVCGSFIPPGGEDHVLRAGDYAWLTTEEDSAYDDLGIGPDDLDIVYAYSWPDEEQVVSELFERHAGPGAVLLSCIGGDNFRLRRKMPPKKKANRSARRRG